MSQETSRVEYVTIRFSAEEFVDRLTTPDMPSGAPSQDAVLGSYDGWKFVEIKCIPDDAIVTDCTHFEISLRRASK